MIRTLSLFVAIIVGWAWAPARGAEAAGQTPEFKEVYDLIRQHAAGISEAELNRAAVQALVSELGPKVSLVTSNAPATAAEPRPVSKSALFDRAIAYVRIARVEDGLAKAVRDSCDTLGATNKLTGLVLDVRYAGGNDYAAVASLADLFLKKERPLLNWGDGMVRSKPKPDVLALPVAVLVNHQTAGAAEAVAAVLRETGVALIFGGTTAGQAMVAQEFPLKNGARLRIATAPIQLGDGSTLSSQGVKPDIAVQVSAAAERAYYHDAFRGGAGSNLLAGTSLSLTRQAGDTNQASARERFNEAELVRERRESLEPGVQPPTSGDRKPEEPVVHDPALARALDVLKGLAVVRQWRS